MQKSHRAHNYFTTLNNSDFKMFLMQNFLPTKTNYQRFGSHGKNKFIPTFLENVVVLTLWPEK